MLPIIYGLHKKSKKSYMQIKVLICVRPWGFAPKPHKPSLAQEFCLVKNFPTENCLRQRRFLRRSQQNGYAAASIFAVPKRLDLNFDKIFQFCYNGRVRETKRFPNGIRRTSGQNFATQNGFASLFLRVPLCPFEEKTEFQGF